MTSSVPATEPKEPSEELKALFVQLRRIQERIAQLSGHQVDVVVDRVEAFARLRASEERFRLLSKATDDAIYDWDLASGEVWWNDGLETLFGFLPEEETREENWVSHIHPEDRERVLADIAEAIQSRQDKWSSEYRFLRKDGSTAVVADRGYMIRGEDGEVARMIGGMTDITERRMLEEQILRSQRLESLGTLAGGLAHDLNNLLAPILLSADILQETVRDDESLAIVETVRASAERGAQLIRRLLGFARGVEGQRRHIDLAELAQEIGQVIRETFPRDIECCVQTAPDLLPVEADPAQVHQVLMNLCVNARDAMPGGGKLSIQLQNLIVDEVFASMNLEAKPGPYVMIQIEDRGSGMSAQTQSRIFEPFFSTKGVGEGTGLGLSTVFSIVRGHGGFIQLSSELGRGTRFQIYLPAVKGAGKTLESYLPRVGAALPRGRGELILVVDDEEDVRNTALRVLTRFGYQVLLAENGADAIAVYLRNRANVRCVLMDMSMPVMDGPAAVAALKALDREIPVIGSSGLGSQSGVGNLTSSELAYFVPKPYTATTLLQTIRAALAEGPEASESSSHAPAAATKEQAQELLRRRGQRSLLLVDHELALRNMCAKVLQRSGFQVHTAESTEEALSGLREGKFAVDAVISDPGLTGLAAAQLVSELRKISPDIKVLLTSGGALQPEVSLDYHLLPKPFNLSELVAAVESLCPAPPEPG